MTETSPTGAAELREERKVVSALFADLVGSTALAERLEAEEVRLVVGEAVARMVAEVEKLGGHVKDLAGDGVLAFFGAPVSYEDDAERAVRAGLAIVEELEGYGADVARGWGVEGFAGRVGIATGPVVLGTVGGGSRVEYGAFGDTVNTAARLQAAADPGTVLVDRGTHRLVELLFDWDEPRQLMLKGKEKPTSAFTARSALSVTGRPRGLEGAQTRLVGRERELAAGQEAVDRVLSGAGVILFVTGEAGIGKSRLLLELRDAFEGAASQGGRPLWLEGRCVSYGESLSYWPFRDLIREWVGVGPNEPELRVRVALRRKLGELFGDRTDEVYPYLGTLLGLALEPDASARLAELSPEALQYRTFEVGRTMLERLAADGPVVVAMEDLHWADATSVQLLEQLLPTAEGAPVLFLVSQRNERDHPSWQLKEVAAREFPHLLREIALEPLSGDANRELLETLVGRGTLPDALERRVLAEAEGNPFYLEELVRSLADVGVLAHAGDGWRFEREVPIEIPATVEKVILARIDRLSADCHDVLTAASALGRRFPLSLLEGVLNPDGGVRDALHDLQRLDLIREGRRWPEPEYRFKHALIQEAAYRTLLSGPRTQLHRRAAEWLERRYEDNEEEVLGLLAHHWRAADDEEKAVRYLTRAGDRARQEYTLDEAIEHYRSLLPLLERRGEAQEIALVLFKLALALHTSLRFSEANRAYQRAFEHWSPPAAQAGRATATLRMASSYVPSNLDPSRAGWWPDIQVCMQLFDRLVEAGPERTIVPSLAERWDISDDGLRYVFHLREGTVWSDGTPLTAHDVEFGIKRVLDPQQSGASVSIYFVLENGQDYYQGRSRDPDRIGVTALDDRTIEFRLVAPAPYFMSVMNRPDGGPQPRHSIERDGSAWTRPERQVVSGPFRQLERSSERLVLARNEWYTGGRTGNVARVEYVSAIADDALGPFERGELDAIRVMYTPRTADHVRSLAKGEGPLTWTAYLGFDHSHELVSNVELRRALAWAVDREALASTAPVNLVVASGGVVPPAIHGHTPEIVPRLDRERAREHLRRADIQPDAQLSIAAQDAWAPMLEQLAAGWRETLGLDVALHLWSVDDVPTLGRPLDLAPIAVFGWLPGYPDPEYMLRLLLHSNAKTNEGGFAYEPFDELIERARQERNDRARLELYHEADRMAVADQVALIPLAYGRSMSLLKPAVKGWWEFAKSSASYADLVVERD